MSPQLHGLGWIDVGGQEDAWASAVQLVETIERLFEAIGLDLADASAQMAVEAFSEHGVLVGPGW
jgi:hypothetical protein